MQQIDHRIIKLLVGIIAVSLALFMQFASGEVLNSISESYHYRARDWFVGLLFAVAVLFLSFKGENSFERKLTIFASICAVVLAIAPCDCGRNVGSLSNFHFPAAAGVFAIMGYFCWRFKKTAEGKCGRYPEAKNRVNVYRACFAGMIVCLFMMIGYFVAHETIDRILPSYVFWLEFFWLLSFGVSWLTASRTFPLITNPKERFSLVLGKAQEDSLH